MRNSLYHVNLFPESQKPIWHFEIHLFSCYVIHYSLYCSAGSSTWNVQCEAEDFLLVNLDADFFFFWWQWCPDQLSCSATNSTRYLPPPTNNMSFESKWPLVAHLLCNLYVYYQMSMSRHFVFVLVGILRLLIWLSFCVSVIDDALCEKRLWDMKYKGVQNFYMCELRKDFTIDATFKGNLSRFLNHSCDPNCKLEKWLVNFFK